MSRGAPQKRQRRSYSGRKRGHSQKAQVIADRRTGQIIAAFCRGRTHDLRLFGQSRTAMAARTEHLADSGYLELVKCHANSRTPHERGKHHALTGERRAQNRQFSRERFVIEHVIRSLKVFRVLSERYRSRRRRFGLRFNLTAAIYNHELTD